MKIPSSDERHEILIALRNKKMACSPHAYMRGNTTSQMSPALGGRIIAQRFLEHGVFIRELLSQDLKLELDQMSI